MKSIFVLTGAGISAESGIQTFRGSDGLWEGHRLEDVASPGGFQRDPSMVCRFYNMRRAKIRDAAPNAAHFVWFGEIPLFMEEIGHALTQADLFISIGTSGVVYPAAPGSLNLSTTIRGASVSIAAATGSRSAGTHAGTS